MAQHIKVKRQIDSVVRILVELGLAQDQNFAFCRDVRGGVEVSFPASGVISDVLKDLHYYDVYDCVVGERAYIIKMPDGAALQMMYFFVRDVLLQHRLAFYPSPYLDEFQNNPELYLQDELYADIVSKSVVPFPVRFDYDSRGGVVQELYHPASHLTLGQYENCRIPVSAPLTPIRFVDFVLRSFYSTAYVQYADQMPNEDFVFSESIFPIEKTVLHVQVPHLRL